MISGEFAVNGSLTDEQRKMLLKLKDVEPVPDEDCPEYSVEDIKRLRKIAAQKHAERNKRHFL